MSVVYVVVFFFVCLIGFRMVVVRSAYAADFDVEIGQMEATNLLRLCRAHRNSRTCSNSSST